MKIQREKLFEMNQLFDKLAKEASSVKFHFMIIKNQRLITDEIESMREANKPSEDSQKFDNARVELLHFYAEKDENGQSKIKNNQFILAEETKKEFEEKLLELQEEYKDVIDSLETSRTEFLELLKSDTEIELVKIPMSIVPDTLLGEEVEILFDIIEEDK